MARVTNLKRIVKEDFPAEYQELVEKMAFSINPLTEQLTAAFANGIDFENLSQQFAVITVKVDGTGAVTTSGELKYTLKTRIKGIQCIRAENLTDSTPLTGAPFVSFTMRNNIIQFTHITGLVPGKEYRLSLVIPG